MRLKIVEALVSGKPYREIAAWTNPPVTPMALSRYKARAMEDLVSATRAAKQAIVYGENGLTANNAQAVTRAALVAATDPFLSRVMELRRDRQEVKEACLSSLETPDLSTWAKLDGNDLKELELHARLAGRLDSAGAQVNVQIVIPATREPQVAPIGEDDSDVLTIDIGSK